MATYLLAWNPLNWSWSKFVRAHGIDADPKVHRWRTHSHQISRGDRVFIAKVGKPPRGIFAAGYAEASPRPKENPKKAWYVPIRLSKIIDPNDQPILLYSELRSISSQFKWTPQGSGIQIPDDIAQKLEATWFRFSGDKVAKVNIDLRAIAKQLNLQAREHPIGKLQEIRAGLRGLSRRAGSEIFSSKTTHDEWACHHGGRSELQFNIGLEEISDVSELRHGVAFSFELSQSLPSIDILIPKVRLFNEFIRANLERFSDMRMWYYRDSHRSSDHMPGPIAAELATEGTFVFLGKRQKAGHIDMEEILGDFDRLLPLYRYVESSGNLQTDSLSTEEKFSFRAGCTSKASSTVATPAQKQLDVTLRHNELQEALHRKLVVQFGKNNVGTELVSSVGTSVDVVVRRSDGYWFYEIKTSQSPKMCIREAVGQLMEYAFWPGAQEAIRLVVVGESKIDRDGEVYLRRLRERFSLPIYYEQIVT